MTPRGSIVKPSVLILSNRFDFSVDYISAGLDRLGVAYLRLNSEDFSQSEIALYPVGQRLVGRVENTQFEISPQYLRSIYFRCPVFLRETSGRPLSPEQQLSVGQWSAFLRSLMIFSDRQWINHPAATYAAECKPMQLAIAGRVGFAVPHTVISNSASYLDSGMKDLEGCVAIKSLDTVVLNDASRQAFVYTNIVPANVVVGWDFSSAPVIFQKSLHGKVDVRVTVVRDSVFPVRILRGGRPISGDWRTIKDDVTYEPFTAPGELADLCRSLVRALGLSFGAIDLAQVGDEFYFLELNPTGEWAWLVESAGLPIDRAITQALIDGKPSC